MTRKLLLPGLCVACFCLCLPLFLGGKEKDDDFKNLCDSFYKGYKELSIPETAFDYHDYFNNIPGTEQLQKQEIFFKNQADRLSAINKGGLSNEEKLYYEHLHYEIDINLDRISLEKQWVQAGRKIPEGGIYTLGQSKPWYRHFVKEYTSTDISPEDVFALGLSETKRVQREIKRIESALGFTNDSLFYLHLQNDSFYLHDKEEIIRDYAAIDKTVRSNLYKIVQDTNVPAIEPMEWPDAGPNTPPGIYLDKANNAYGRDVFQFNFYKGRHNKRSMEWLYMHEAIPGHHLQFTFRLKINAPDFQKLFLYPGNFEGWGCYVEYMGKEAGLYKNPYSELGKWQWDLVRSVRLALDVGVHYYGWNRAKAMQFWKQNIYGQDDIADREITRITNWPCQALSYKVGAAEIEKIKTAAMQNNPDLNIVDFHERFLELSYFPLEIVEKQLNKDFAKG